MDLHGNFLDFFIAFASGVIVSFTPCVYPVMPLTASFIAGANIKGTRWGGFFISLVYVFGMAITYCSLGAVAALSGKVFGQLQNNPWVLASVGVIFIFFSLVMIDVISLPTWGLNLKKEKPTNMLAVLLFGMTSGLIVGPCTAPVLGALLTRVAERQNVFFGMILLFIFSYGVGFSLILIGTFSGLLSRMPKSGFWLVRVKQFSGLILFLFGLHFLYQSYQLFK